MLACARRLAGEPGERVVRLSAGAIRGVALGIVVTALVQAVIGGIGLAVTGVPHALLLASIMFLLAIAQIGPAPVLLGGAVWLYAGVLGGMLAFGLIGLFIGPVVLAVTYTLLVAWVAEGDSPPVWRAVT